MVLKGNLFKISRKLKFHNAKNTLFVYASGKISQQEQPLQIFRNFFCIFVCRLLGRNSAVYNINFSFPQFPHYLILPSTIFAILLQKFILQIQVLSKRNLPQIKKKNIFKKYKKKLPIFYQMFGRQYRPKKETLYILKNVEKILKKI